MKAYPADAAAQLIADIANTKTLTRHTLNTLLKAGASIQEVDRHGTPSHVWQGNTAISAMPAIR